MAIRKNDVLAASAALAAAVLQPLPALAQQTSAERCQVRAADATADSREEAIRVGYEVALEAIDPRMAKAWAARNGRIGEAPGYHVSRLTTRCTPAGRRYRCYVEIRLCR